MPGTACLGLNDCGCITSIAAGCLCVKLSDRARLQLFVCSLLKVLQDGTDADKLITRHLSV